MVTLQHKFVELIPDSLADNILYVSLEYRTVIHKCGCGCGREIVTPISPNDWQLNFDGKTISLYPSIGNYNIPCKSHYWIRNNTINFIPDHKAKKPANEKKAGKRRRKTTFSKKKKTSA
jgi:hypothetical protein